MALSYEWKAGFRGEASGLAAGGPSTTPGGRQCKHFGDQSHIPRPRMSPQRIYLDYNATAPLLPAARDAMVDAMALPGNPSSIHAEGRAARHAVETARGAVAGLMGVRTRDVTFTARSEERRVGK